MENRFLKRIDDIIIVNIKSKNINRLLRNIYGLNIELFNITKINYKEINIEIYKKDYEKIKRLSILNKVNIIDYKGKLKLKNKLIFNKTFIACLIIGLFFLFFLSNIIFSIEIIHTDKKLKDKIYNELYSNGIKLYKFKKSFKELEKVKNRIIDNNKNDIEWLEIESVGTKYIVRVEERKINNNKIDTSYQDIISTKDAVVKKITASNGVIISHINDYVKKGDILISGSIYLNDSLKKLVKATGTVYGEVWYNLSMEYPINDMVTNETGNKKVLYSINILNKRITIGNSFKNSNIVRKFLSENKLLPFSISKDTEYEVEKIDGIYSEGEVLLNARNYAKEKIKELLQKDEYIISDSILNYRVNSNTIYMEIFYKVYMNITGEKEIIIER